MRRALSWVTLSILVVVGCSKTKEPANGKATAHKGADRAPHAPAPGRPAPGPRTTGPTGLMQLSSHHTIAPPAGGTVASDGEKGEWTYVLPSGARLTVSEEDPGGECGAALQKSYEQSVAIKSDPTQQTIARLDALEWRQVAGRKAIYAAVGNRSPQEAEANAPYHPSAMIGACDVAEVVIVTVSARDKLSEEDLASLGAVAGSLTN